ncbi:Hypothetical predicted protein [Cloeon dipterum]|uniref:Uncharacterized protein n=1 Tax=Cloeon dipterum TaxID=197152 RepID=A0A8S1DXU0_9INSE|nr:Hypothetical predicted protein [Cloeon dipterum]
MFRQLRILTASFQNISGTILEGRSPTRTKWKMHHNEGDHFDLTNAFPADPQVPKPQRLYFGRYSPGDGPIYYGQVYEDGKSCMYFAENILLSCPSFEVLEYKPHLRPAPVDDEQINFTVDGNES